MRGTVHLFPTSELAFWLAALRQKPAPRVSTTASEVLPHERATRAVGAIGDLLDLTPMTKNELEAALVQRLGAWLVDPKFAAFGGKMSPWR
ncbi:MAG: winged helix DNA-binding domain-containing protein [Chloroflexi bacterium]|nr:winged helix DNA-binding domain-containing protein [Chloroflexota bacterium]